MEKINDIIEKIELFSPLTTQQEWDNSGWQIKSDVNEVEKVLLTLDINQSVVEQAIKEGCNLILSHHPLFFSPVKSLKCSYILEAIKHNISIYSAHTNLDIADGGLNDCFAKICGFPELYKLNDFVKYAKLNHPCNMGDFIQKLKINFNINSLKIANLNKNEFSSVAFCSGSGGEFIDVVEDKLIDVYLTGDVKYHQAQSLNYSTVIDIGHFNSESCVVEVFSNILAESKVELICAKGCDVFEYI